MVAVFSFFKSPFLSPFSVVPVKHTHAPKARESIRLGAARKERWKLRRNVLHQDQGAFDRLARLLKLKLASGHGSIPSEGS